MVSPQHKTLVRDIEETMSHDFIHFYAGRLRHKSGPFLSLLVPSACSLPTPPDPLLAAPPRLVGIELAEGPVPLCSLGVASFMFVFHA